VTDEQRDLHWAHFWLLIFICLGAFTVTTLSWSIAVSAGLAWSAFTAEVVGYDTTVRRALRQLGVLWAQTGQVSTRRPFKDDL
jgi:hypothetical protein